MIYDIFYVLYVLYFDVIFVYIYIYMIYTPSEYWGTVPKFELYPDHSESMSLRYIYISYVHYMYI